MAVLVRVAIVSLRQQARADLERSDPLALALPHNKQSPTTQTRLGNRYVVIRRAEEETVNSRTTIA